MTSWMPDFCSSSASLGSSASRVCCGMMLAWSTMRPVSGGKVRASAAPAARTTTTHSDSNRVIAGSAPLRGAHALLRQRCATEWRAPSNESFPELHLRRLLRVLVGGELGHRLAAADHGPDLAGEGPDLGVVGAHRLDVVAPRHGDAVLGAFELALQRQEVLVRLQVGIVLADRDQPAERA